REPGVLQQLAQPACMLDVVAIRRVDPLLRRTNGYAGPQARQHVPVVTVTRVVSRLTRRPGERYPEPRLRSRRRKSLGHYTDDAMRHAAQPDVLSDHVRIAVEHATPESVAEHGKLVLLEYGLALSEHAAHHRWHAQHLKVRRRDQIGVQPHGRPLAARVVAGI